MPVTRHTCSAHKLSASASRTHPPTPPGTRVASIIPRECIARSLSLMFAAETGRFWVDQQRSDASTAFARGPTHTFVAVPVPALNWPHRGPVVRQVRRQVCVLDPCRQVPHTNKNGANNGPRHGHWTNRSLNGGGGGGATPIHEAGKPLPLPLATPPPPPTRNLRPNRSTRETATWPRKHRKY